MDTTKKVSKPAPRVIRAASRSVAVRHRSHTLAPEHLGEAGSIATLAVGVGGVALLITGVSIVVSGLTIGARYAASTPPNVGQLGTAQIVGGVALLLLSMALVAAASAVLLDVRGGRMLTIALAALTAALCVAGVLLVMTVGGGDRLVALALLVGGVMFGASSIVLFRTRRPTTAD